MPREGMPDADALAAAETGTYVTSTFGLQHCNCTRTLHTLRNNSQADFYLNDAGSSRPGPDYWKTTCSQDAVRRGRGQRVVAYSFYGSPRTERHKAKQYFAGIVENLGLVRRLYPGWVMRLYYDLSEDEKVAGELCELACGSDHLDLCDVRQLPGTPMRDASKVFPMNWRFFPTLDPQVHLILFHLLAYVLKMMCFILINLRKQTKPMFIVQ
jgi:hypothetical protein